MKVRYILLSLFVFLSACSTVHKKRYIAPRTAQFYPVSFRELDGWERDHQAEALKALYRSCQVFMKQGDNNSISHLTSIGGLVKDWKLPCVELTLRSSFTNSEARAFFEKWFTPYKVTNDKGKPLGKLTGYYEIELRGSRKKSRRYKYPIYAPPADLRNTLGHYKLSHAAINKGALHGKGLEIVWVDNRAKLYFLHIQGSGVIVLDNGEEVRVGYAGQNGFEYKSIGPMMKNYSLDKIDSALGIMDWLHRNPQAALNIMEKNPSYVFFQEVDAESAIGAQTVPLQAERSLAIDKGLYPYGAPIWVETTSPRTLNHKSRAYNRLFIAQDTGGAIKGAVRGDIFYGRGKKAEEFAAYMNNYGKFFILLPKSVKVPKSYTSRK